MALRGFAPD